MHQQKLLVAFACIAVACGSSSSPDGDAARVDQGLVNATSMVAENSKLAISAPVRSENHVELPVETITARPRLMSSEEVQKMLAKSDFAPPRKLGVEEAFQTIKQSADRSHMGTLIDQYLEAVSALPTDQQSAAKQRLVDHFAQGAEHP